MKMSTPHYEIFAIKYAQVGRKAWGNFIDGDPHEDSDMPLDYFVWAVVGGGRTIVVDTGFDATMAKKRDRKIVHPVEEGLEAVGVRHSDVRDVVVTHMHYDHCGNGDLFPNARFHMQDTEMEYVTGRCMCHHQIAHAFEPEDVSRMVYRVFAGSVQFHDGNDEIAPGVTVHKIGGHTKGLQCVRVATKRGYVVLASDATHFYQHIGLYAYRRDFLLKLATLPRAPLEQVENLEQLRVLHAGQTILVGVIDEPTIGIDTPADYAAFVKRWTSQV